MIHKLPALTDPVKYTGLYIFDFGDHAAVGYTAEEIKILLAEEKYAGGEVYRIYRAHADGTLDLCSVNPQSWSQTTGIVFRFDDKIAALQAMDELASLVAEASPPGEVEAVVVQKEDEDTFSYALVLRYNADLDDAVASWLIKIDYQAGENVEAGQSAMMKILDGGVELCRQRFDAGDFRRSRLREEVLTSVDRPIQR
jgi:hypothetical protein